MHDLAEVRSPIDWTKVDPPSWTDGRALALPVFVYEVLAPERLSGELDMLEEAVLDMARAGLRGKAAISERLHLHPRLVGVVSDALRRRGLLDPQGSPVGTGTEDTESPVQRRLIHVLQDPFTHKMWRTLPQVLLGAPVEKGKGNTSLLRIANSAVRLDFVDVPSTAIPSPPSAAQILALNHRLARSSRARRTEAIRFTAEQTEDADDLEAVDLVSVEYLSTDPRVVYMPALFLLPKPPADADGYATYGVDGDADRNGMAVLERAAHHSDEARRVLEQLDKKARERHSGPRREYLDRLRVDSEGRLERVAGKRWRDYPTVWGDLVTLQFGILECDEDPERGAWRSKDLVVAAGRAVETTFMQLARLRPLATALEEALKVLEATGPRSLPVPIVKQGIADAARDWAGESMTFHLKHWVQETDLKGWLKKGRLAGFTKYQTLLVLEAHYDVEHDLRRLIAERPGLFLEAEAIVDVRNKAGAHGNSASIPFPLAIDVANKGVELSCWMLSRMTLS